MRKTADSEHLTVVRGKKRFWVASLNAKESFEVLPECGCDMTRISKIRVIVAAGGRLENQRISDIRWLWIMVNE